MRNRITGVIGILWGGGVVVSFFMRGGNIGGGSYGAGQFAGLLIGVVMFGAGIYYVTKSNGSN